MKIYYLSKNIHIIKGAKKHCIYDLERERLFSIDESALDMIYQFINTNKKVLSKQEKTFLDQLLDYGILTTETQSVTDKIHNKEPHIKFAWIEVTKTCNLRCIHCYNEAEYQENFSKKNMGFQEFCRVVDMLENMGVQRIQLIGGEPYIIGSTLTDMLKYVKDKFEFIEIFTNGTLIKEADIEELLENKVSQVALSVYSNFPSEHDKVTKSPGSHGRIARTIKVLEEKNIPFRIANVRMKEILIGESSMDIITPESGYDYVRLSGRGNLQLYDKDLLKQKLITKKRFQKKISRASIEKNMSLHNCFSNKIYIDVDLNVYPCVMERRVKHGNVKSEELKDILKHKIMTYTKDQVSECKHCEYRYACHDCRPDSLSDSVDAKPWYCTYNPYNGEWYDIEEFIKKLEVQI